MLFAYFVGSDLKGTDVMYLCKMFLYFFILGTSCRHRCHGAEVVYIYFYFFVYLSSVIEYRTLSQICGRLYLPIFLFRVGLFTHIYI